jgi:formylglycine-generating enzyme required for sulfatase activity
LFLVPTLLWGSPAPAPGIQANVRSSIGEDRMKGDPPPGMIAIETRRSPWADQRRGARAAADLHVDVDRRLIVGSGPDHAIQVEKFLLDKFEVTNQQYRTWLEATHRKPSDKLIEFNWPKGQFPPGQENFPVCGVNLVEAQACARWMGQEGSHRGRVGARGARHDAKAKENRFVWGKTWDHTKCSNARTSRGNPVAVGSFKDDVSPFQIFDMMGNVAEWTTSKYTSYPGFKPLDLIDPVSKSRSPSARSSRRCGTWCAAARRKATSELQHYLRQGFSASDRWSRIGFRCAKSLIPGRDAIDDAVDDLTIVSELNKNPLNLKDICAQEIMYQDPASNYMVTAASTWRSRTWTPIAPRRESSSWRASRIPSRRRHHQLGEVRVPEARWRVPT